MKAHRELVGETPTHSDGDDARSLARFARNVFLTTILAAKLRRYPLPPVIIEEEIVALP
jgi:hypothetical protein